MLFVITYHLVEARKIAMMCLSVVCRPMPVSVCLSVCLSASLSHKPHVQTLPNFLCTLLVAVTRPTSGSISIRNVLPVSWSTSCLLITIRHIGDVKMAILEVTHQWAAPNEKSDVCNHPLASHTDTIFFETYFQMSVVTWSSAPLVDILMYHCVASKQTLRSWSIAESLSQPMSLIKPMGLVAYQLVKLRTLRITQLFCLILLVKNHMP